MMLIELGAVETFKKIAMSVLSRRGALLVSFAASVGWSLFVSPEFRESAQSRAS
jgi:hypothetical protein